MLDAFEELRMGAFNIEPDLTVFDLLEKWPLTITVFQDYRMGCVGCVMAPFETLTEATEIYKIPLNQFIFDLKSVIAEVPVGPQTP
jgi:hybrid cluster-associated redox disulfide protein